MQNKEYKTLILNKIKHYRSRGYTFKEIAALLNKEDYPNYSTRLGFYPWNHNTLTAFVYRYS
jgi:DNA-binding transcriptional MerR regulator